MPTTVVISMPLGELAAAAADWPKRWRSGPVAGQSSSPRSAGNGSAAGTAGADGSRRRQIAQRGLQALLRVHQLAGQLRVQVAPPIDVGDQRLVLLQCGRSSRLGALRCRRGSEASCARRSSRAVPACLQLVDAPLMRRHPIAVAPRDRGDHARGLSDIAGFGRRQEQPDVAALSKLVQLDEPGTERGTLGLLLRVEARQLFVEPGEVGGCALFVGLRLAELFVLDLTFQLQAAQVPEQRARLRGEPVRFLVQRLEPFAGRCGERLGTRAIVLRGAVDGRRNR